MSLCRSRTQSSLLRTVKGRIISQYSWGLKSPRRTSSQTFQMNDEISLWLTDILIYLIPWEYRKKRKNSCKNNSHSEGLYPLYIGTLTYPKQENQSKRWDWDDKRLLAFWNLFGVWYCFSIQSTFKASWRANFERCIYPKCNWNLWNVLVINWGIKWQE